MIFLNFYFEGAMMKMRLIVAVTVFGVSLLGATAPSPAQEAEASRGSNRTTAAPSPRVSGSGVIRTDCTLDNPGVVQRLRVQCTGTRALDVRVADCCIPGDHFQVKVKAFDQRPNIAIATSPGPDSAFGAPARVYSYGGAPESPGALDAIVECSYLHGVNVFPANALLTISGGRGHCTAQALGGEAQIDESR